MAEKLDHDKLIRWLRGLAEAAVTASGSRATFTSDMYFDAADAIGNLHADKVFLMRAIEQALEMIDETGALVSTDDEFAALREALSSMKGGK